MELLNRHTLYLYSTDYPAFSAPNEIVDYATTMIGTRHCLKVTLCDPLIGQKYGYGGDDIDTVYLLGRFDDLEVVELKKFPVHVHVLIPYKGAIDLDDVKNYQNVAWAELSDDLNTMHSLK